MVENMSGWKICVEAKEGEERRILVLNGCGETVCREKSLGKVVSGVFQELLTKRPSEERMSLEGIVSMVEEMMWEMEEMLQQGVLLAVSERSEEREKAECDGETKET